MPPSTVATPQRRPRRRKIPKTSEKENAHACADDCNASADTIKPQYRQTSRKNDLLSQENDDNIAIDVSLTVTSALTKFQDSVEATKSSSYWKRHASLAECVVQASQSLCVKKTSSLLLDEHASELLSTCRTLVKEATESKHYEQTLKLLNVAIHGLRALCPTLVDMKRMEAAMKILYHAVTIASDVCTKSKDMAVCTDAAMHCLAAFQALGSLLNGYKVQAEDDKCIIIFKWKTMSTPVDLFPLPSLSSSETASEGCMTVKQLYKIAMQATVSVASSLAHVYSLIIRSDGATSCSNDFGPHISVILQQIHQPSFETILRMAQEVMLPWTCFFSSDPLATEDNIQDSLTYTKRAFRLLFDVASQIDKCIAQSPTRKTLLAPANSLRLRKDAILVYLLDNRNTKISRSAQVAVKKHHWQGACTYACKASVAYRQYLSQRGCSETDECLDHFHMDVGKVLDSLATEYALSYIEYSAYRALHVSPQIAQCGACESQECIFGQLGFRFQHRECMVAETTNNSSEAAGQATLAIFFLVLRIQSELYGAVNGRQNIVADEAIGLVETRQGVIAAFKAVFVDKAHLPPCDEINRCYKLLETLSLNRTIYRILLNDTQVCYSNSALNALETSGRILAECIGPFAVLLVRSGNTRKQQTLYLELAVDAYSRGLAVFERLCEQQLRPENPTDDAMLGLFSLCDDDELSSLLSEETLEKAAKAIFSVGRGRRERKEYSQAISPLCLGNDLFSRLVEMRGPQAAQQLQLSMRYSHLASAFDSVHMTEEACLSLVLAVVYDMIDSIVAANTDNDEKCIQLLKALSALTNGVVLMESAPVSHGSRRSLIARLVRLSESLSQEPWSIPVFPAGEDFMLLTRTFLRGSAGFQSNHGDESPADSNKPTRFSLATLLSFALKDSKVLRPLKKSRTDCLRKEQVLLMADVVAEQGALLRQEVSLEHSQSTLEGNRMKEFNKSFLFLERLAKTTFHNEQSRQAPVAIIHIIAAASMVPPVMVEFLQASQHYTSPNQNEEGALLLKARKLLSKTFDILTGSLEQRRDEEQQLMSSSLLACAALFSSELSVAYPAIISTADKSIILSSAHKAAQLLMETDSIHDEVRASLRICLTRTLTRFQDMVNLEGDTLKAAQAALLVAQVQDGIGNEDETWYWASASNLLHDAGFQSVAKDIVGHKQDQNQIIIRGNNFKMKDALKLEMVATQCRMNIHSVDVDASKTAAVEAKNLLDKCSIMLSGRDTEPLTKIALRWVCSSCVMALAEGFESCGTPNLAVKYLRKGVNLCRESNSALRRLKNVSALVSDGDSSSTWADVALSTFLLRFMERRITAQKFIATLYARLGDHRRSEAYAVGAAKECLLGDQNKTKQRLKIQELASIDRSQLHVMCQSASYRLLLEMKTKASPPDFALESLHKSMVFDGILRPLRDGQAASEVSWHVDNIWNLVNAGDLHYLAKGDSHTGERFKQFYQAADIECKELMSSPTTAHLLSSLPYQQLSMKGSQKFASLQAEVQLRTARVLLSEPSDRNEREASDLLIKVTETSAASGLCRACAHYYLGLLHMKIAHQSGAVHDLWIDQSGGTYISTIDVPQKIRRDGKHSIEIARSHMQKALLSLGPASDTLSRDVMRCLALLAGPSRSEESGSMSAFALIHSSIGSTARQLVTSALVTDDNEEDGICSCQMNACKEEKLFRIFDSLDAPWGDLFQRNKRINFLLEEVAKCLPTNCQVVAIALCPTGEILVSSVCQSAEQPSNLDIDTVCIFPDSDRESILDNTAYCDIMKPLDEIIRLNEDQIRGLDSATVADNFKEKASKRDWWNDRQQADDRLQSLIEDVESRYFSCGGVKRMFLGDHDDDDDDFSISCGNLASKFEKAYAVEGAETDDDGRRNDDVDSMTVSQLKDELEQLHVHVMTRKKPSKKQLIDMLIEAREANGSRTAQTEKVSSEDENCILLVLDENLNRFPFEGMGICSKSVISRIPSLPFVVASLTRSEDESDVFPVVKPSESRYIVDPEGNLSQTKNRLVPAINTICESNGWNWRSVVGSLPTEKFVNQALTQPHGLLLYCGHGGATCCFSRTQVETLMKDDGIGGPRRCRSSLILMGCSSGKLVSVNRKDTKITDKVTLFYEPEGIALSYLCAGAPCVVGNLWDVTDRDIDRYCIALLDKFLGSNDGHSLAKCVAEARSSCKMRHLVGLAPVCYGVPVHVLNM